MPHRGRILKISHYAIHDGPGIRTTVFLKGCPGRCLWCCSPESQSFQMEIMPNPALCASCLKCEGACPMSAISSAEGRPVLDSSKCDLCGECVRACPKGAIEIAGRDITPRELFDAVRRDAPFWRRSGGGVTLSGGEVLSQPAFAAEFLDICRARGVHTAIETCLFASRGALETVAARTDFIQFDIKAVSRELHLRLTSISNGPILDNAAWLLQGDKTLLVRYPLIPGCNDDAEISALGAFCASNRPGVTVELLPYHSLGVSRYEALGREYALPGTKPPDAGRMRNAAGILRSYGLEVICGRAA